MDANQLFNLMTSIELATEREEKRTGKPLKLTKRKIVEDCRMLKTLKILK